MKIAWLVQSDNFTLLDHQSNDISQFADIYRYNWKRGCEDKSQNTPIKAGLSWSGGRGALYDFARSQKSYDYYVFIDDDIVLNDGKKFSDLINYIKKHYSATQAGVFTVRSDCWHEWFLRKFNVEKDKRIFCTDLQFQMISSEICELSFPVIFDGGWGTLWYPMFIACKNNNYPLSIRCFSISNKNSNKTFEYGGIENQNSHEIWRRSERFLPGFPKLIGRILGFRRAILFLNIFYSLVK